MELRRRDRLKTVPHSHGRGRIVVGFDGSTTSYQALRWAAVEAQRRTVPIVIVRVSPDVAVPAIEELDAALDELRLITSGSVQCRGRFDIGSPETVLLAEAAPDDLLVIGSADHPGPLGAVSGSVSRACVAGARCPVMVIGPRVALSIALDKWPRGAVTAEPSHDESLAG